MSSFIFTYFRKLSTLAKAARPAVGIVLALGIAALLALSARAAATLTPATGGEALSADLSAGTFATLVGPIISEGATADIGVGTIVLNAPAGFAFDTGGTAPTVLVTRIAGSGSATRNINDLASGSTIAVTRASTTLTITITAASSNAVRNSLTWQDVRVRPTAGTPLGSGNITKGGTSAIVGIANGANLGSLAEVAGAKAALAFAIPASGSAIVDADIATPPSVAVTDQFGNIVTSDNASTVTLVPVLASGTCAGPAGTGVLTLSPANGSAVANGVLAVTTLRYSVAESIRLCATSPGIASALGTPIAVEHPVPAIASLAPTSTLAGSGPFSLIVRGSGFRPVSTVLWNGAPRTTAYASSTELSASILATDLAAPGTASVSVSTPAPGGGTSASLAFAIAPAATKFVILPPTDGTVDAAVSVTIEAEKADGSRDESFNDDVTLLASGSASGDGLIDITGGVGVAMIANTAAETIALSLSDTEATGLDVSSTEDIVFAPGALAQLRLNDPGGIVAGARAGYVAERTDQYGNAVILGTTTIALFGSSPATFRAFFSTATGGSPISSVAVFPGASSANFWYEEGSAGTWTVTASDNATAPDGAAGIADAADAIAVTAGPTAAYALSDPGGMTAGSRIGYTVTRKDAFGNPTTSGSATAYLSTDASGPSTFFDAAAGGNAITSVAFADGASSANFWYEEGSAGTWTVTASDNATAPDGAAGIADAADAIAVAGAPVVPTRIVIRPVASATVDAPAIVTIALEDGSGNTATTATGTVTLLTTGSATGGGVATLTNGIGTASIVDHTAETITLSLADTGGTGLDVSSTRTVVFGAGALAQLVFDAPGNMAAGGRLGFALTRKDQYGNAVTAGVASAYLYTSALAASSGFFAAASGGGEIASVLFLDGGSVANVWYEDERAGSVTITASDNATAPDGAAGIADGARTFTVLPGAVARLSLDDPGDMSAGTRLPYSVSRSDVYGNPVSAGVQTVSLYTTSPASGSGFFDTSAGGSETTIAVFPDGVSSANFWYEDVTPGIWTITASDNATAPDGAAGIADASDTLSVLALPIVATRLAISAPSVGTVGVPLAVTIRAEDSDGDLDTTATGTVTLLTTGSATGGGVIILTNGIGTASIVDHTAETITLSLADTGGTGLDVSSTRTVVFGAGSPVVGAAPEATDRASTLAVARVAISGTAAPGALLELVGLGGATSSRATSRARIDGTYALALPNADPSIRSFGVFATDAKGRRTQMRIVDAHEADAASRIALSGIALSPTIGPTRAAATKGDVLGFDGAADAFADVEVEVDGIALSGEFRADAFGRYRGLIDTRELAEGAHTLRARQRTSGSWSAFSPQQVFTVVRIFTPELDHNSDGAIDIRDWSIFVERWSASDPEVRLRNDLNGDGAIDIRDASIFIKTLAPAPQRSTYE